MDHQWKFYWIKPIHNNLIKLAPFIYKCKRTEEALNSKYDFQQVKLVQKALYQETARGAAPQGTGNQI